MLRPSHRQITLDELISLAEASPASRTVSQESDKAKTMSATCGQRCLTLSEPFVRVGSWARTFAGLLVGMEGWSSKRCALTWKIQGTPFNRIYYQLQPSAHPTDATEFGLLLTPTTSEQVQDLDKFKARMEKYPNGTTMPNLATKVVGLLPTPLASEIHHPQRVEALRERGAKGLRERKKGESGANGLTDYLDFNGMLPTPTTDERDAQYKQGGTNLRAAVKGLLPTPTSCDYNTARSPEAWEKAKEKHGSALQKPLKQLAKDGTLPTPTKRDYKGARTKEALDNANRTERNSLPDTFAQDGKTSQLNPRFVAEMMGFPVNWTELPFLSGEQKA